MARREPAEPAPPPYYIADQALFIDNARAFNIGDQVPVDHVARYGWADRVHAPDPSTPAVQASDQPREGES